jgi:hypothetical protein
LVKRDFDYGFRELIRPTEAERKRISKEIIKEVTALPIYGEVYRETCRVFGVKESAELAILTVNLPLHLSLRKMKGLLGFTTESLALQGGEEVSHLYLGFSKDLLPAMRSLPSSER